jgi:hypothetical protein
MKRLFIAMLMVLQAQASNAMGTALGSTIVKIDGDAAAKAFNGSEPTCLKDGAKVLSGNAAYVAKFDKDAKPCRKPELYGVKVIRLKDLDVTAQRKILGIN